MKTKNENPLYKTLLTDCKPPLLAGAVIEQYRKCGKPNCHCKHGNPHGPYHYRTWREAGKQQWEYIRPEDVPVVRAACDTNRELQAQLRINRAEHMELLRQTRAFLRHLEKAR